MSTATINFLVNDGPNEFRLIDGLRYALDPNVDFMVRFHGHVEGLSRNAQMDMRITGLDRLPEGRYTFFVSGFLEFPSWRGFRFEGVYDTNMREGAITILRP